MVKFLFALIILLVSYVSSAEDIAICRGEHWLYKFRFELDKCAHEQKVFKDIPGAYKKGHVSKFEGKDALSITDCWKSMARIQMDGAKCCLDLADGSSEMTSCRARKIGY